MNMSRNTRLAAAAVVVVALSAAGAAIAASKLKGSGHGAGPLGLGAQVVSSSSGGAAGPGYGFRFGDRRGPGGAMPGRHGDDLAAAATYLGSSQADLMTQLQSGKTLAQIAAATSGKSASGLIDAIVKSEQDELDQAVKDGRLTQAQADRLGQNLKARVTARVNGTAPGPGVGPGLRHGPGDDLAAAATYLGSSQTDLMTQLQAGKTLAQIADATPGKSKDGLIAALVAAEQSELAQAVNDGRLTQAQADQLSGNLQARVTQMVEGTLGRHGFGPGPGGRHGYGPPTAPSTGGSTMEPQHI